MHFVTHYACLEYNPFNGTKLCNKFSNSYLIFSDRHNSRFAASAMLVALAASATTSSSGTLLLLIIVDKLTAYAKGGRVVCSRSDAELHVVFKLLIVA